VALALACAFIVLSSQLAFSAEKGRAFGRAESEERRKAEEKRSEEHLRADKRATERAVTDIERVGRKLDVANPQNSEFLDAARLDAEIKTQKTLDRIAKGQTDPHPNDGAIFENRKSPLPPHELGYYMEYVYRQEGAATPGLERVVVGKGGEVYYTPDHYETFLRIR
jgi:guanyl-specific ribonuclease Sa